MAKYLVTGAAGFIASSLTTKLLGQGHDVVGIDNFDPYYDVRLKYFRLAKLLGQTAYEITHATSSFPNTRTALAKANSGSFEFCKISIEDHASLQTLFSTHHFAAVFNLAGRAGVRASLEDPRSYLSANTLGALNVLECTRQYSVPKYIFASSSSVYAGCPLPYREDARTENPASPYAATKLSAELLAHSYHRNYGIDVSILRYFTVFGPAGRPDMAIFRFIKAIDQGVPLEIYGDGSQTRDFTYIDDIVSGTVSSLTQVGFEIFNLGTGQKGVSLSQLISLIETSLGKRAKVLQKPRSACDVNDTFAATEKAASVLGWMPQVTFEEGLGRTVDWWMKNKARLEGIYV